MDDINKNLDKYENAINKLESTQEKEDEWKEFDELWHESQVAQALLEYAASETYENFNTYPTEQYEKFKHFISTHYISKKVLKERLEGKKTKTYLLEKGSQNIKWVD